MIRSQTTTLRQIFYEILLCSQVIFKSMKVADDTFQRNYECLWVNKAGSNPLGTSFLHSFRSGFGSTGNQMFLTLNRNQFISRLRHTQNQYTLISVHAYKYETLWHRRESSMAKLYSVAIFAILYTFGVQAVPNTVFILQAEWFHLKKMRVLKK